MHPVTYFAVLWTIEACLLILNFRIGIFACPEKFVICTEFDWTKKRCRFCFWLCVFFPLQLSTLFFYCIIVWLFLERNLIIAHLDHLLCETQTVFDSWNSFWYKLIIPIKLKRRKPKSSSAGFGPAISGLEVQRAIHCFTMDSAMMKRFCIELSSRLVVFFYLDVSRPTENKSQSWFFQARVVRWAEQVVRYEELWNQWTVLGWNQFAPAFLFRLDLFRLTENKSPSLFFVLAVSREKKSVTQFFFMLLCWPSS